MARPCAAKIPGSAAVLAVVVRAEVATQHAGGVFDLGTRRDFNHFEYVELGCGVFFTLYHEYILEALVIFGTVLSRTITQTIELEAFQSFAYLARHEGAGALAGVSIQERLAIGSVGSLAWWETVSLTEGFDERLGACVL
jgi:hypothetical protein